MLSHNFTLTGLTFTNCHPALELTCSSNITATTFSRNVIGIVADSVNYININNCTFKQSSTHGLTAITVAALNISSSKFIDNSCINVINGAGIYSSYSSVNVEYSLFQNNTGANIGSAVYLHTSTSALFYKVDFTSNKALSLSAVAVYSDLNVSFVSCNFSHNEYTLGELNQYAAVGSIDAGAQTLMTFQSCTFTENVGGGIYTANNHLVVFDCTFNSNTAANGSGIIFHSTSSTTTGLILGSIFNNNVADEFGGGITATQAFLNISNCKFYNNSAVKGGGMYYNTVARDSMIYNCTFEDNTADEGSAAYLFGSRLQIFNNTILRNTANNGSIYFSGGFLDLNYNTISHNTARESGAAFYFHQTEGRIYNLECHSNNATENGGCIYSTASSGTYIQISSITGNKAQHGGGVFMENSFLSFRTVELSQNTAVEEGGGIFVDNSRVLMFTVNIISNTAVYGGGVFLRDCGIYFINILFFFKSITEFI